MSCHDEPCVPQLLRYDMPDGVVAFSTTRQGGVGEGKYGTFNVNDYCGDRPEAINANKTALCKELGIPVRHLLFPHQTHGTEIRQIDETFLSMSKEEQAVALDGVDALVTDLVGICVGVSTADCIPVLLYDPIHQAVAAIHAGWRGTVARIVEKTVHYMRETVHTHPHDLYAIIGPGISLTRFEVGDEVYEQFETAGFNMADIARRQEKWHIDLPLCNVMQLHNCGVSAVNIHDCGICTYDQVERFFSARRLGIHSGRILTAIMMPDKSLGERMQN